MLLTRENKSLLYSLSMLGKNSVMKIVYLYIYIKILLFFGFTPFTVHPTTKTEFVVKFDLQKKRKYQQIIKINQLYLLFFILVQIKFIWKSATFYKTHNTKLQMFKDVRVLIERGVYFKSRV